MEWSDPVYQNLPPIKTVLQLAFYILVGMYAVFSAIIYYHWDAYADTKKVSRVTLIVYLVSTLPLVIIMGGILLII